MNPRIMEQRAPDFGRPFREVRPTFADAEVGLFSDLLDEMKSAYGARLLSVKLVGSRARGTATSTSDYDLLVFLDTCDHDVEVPRLRIVSDRLAAKHRLGPLSLSPMTSDQFHGLDAKYEGITRNFMRDAITLWP